MDKATRVRMSVEKNEWIDFEYSVDVYVDGIWENVLVTSEKHKADQVYKYICENNPSRTSRTLLSEDDIEEKQE